MDDRQSRDGRDVDETRYEKNDGIRLQTASSFRKSPKIFNVNIIPPFVAQGDNADTKRQRRPKWIFYNSSKN